MTNTSRKPEISRLQHGFSHLDLAGVVAILVVLASILIVMVEKVRDNADEATAQAMLSTVRDAVTGSAGAPGYLSDMKYVPGFDPLGIQLSDLVTGSRYPAFATYDPNARRGWRGPNLTSVQPVKIFDAAHPDLPRNGNFPFATDRRFNGDLTFQARGFYDIPPTSSYGTAGDPTIADHWGNPLVIQVPTDVPTDAERFRFVRIVCAGANGKLETPQDRLAGMQADGSTLARGDDLILFLNRSDVYEP